jgi:hypothetical protein
LSAVVLTAETAEADQLLQTSWPPVSDAPVEQKSLQAEFSEISVVRGLQICDLLIASALTLRLNLNCKQLAVGSKPPD